MDPLDLPDLLEVERSPMDLPDLPEFPEEWECPAPRDSMATLASLDPMGPLDTLEDPVCLDSLDLKEHPDSRENPDSPETLEFPAQWDLLVFLACLDRRESLETEEPPVSAFPVPLECLE